MKRAHPYLATIGDKVRKIRKAKKINIRELGVMCKFDYSNLSRFENGEINIKLLSLKTIAEALQVDLKDLL
jgi:transcriptional regulator with XRE-family HTH domain